MRLGVIYNVVYKSRCIYVGSTWNFKDRLYAHKSKCYNPNSKEYHFNIYKFIRKHDVWEAFRFNIIDTIETDDIDHDRGMYERLTAEQFYIDILEPTLNGYNAVVDKVERRRKKDESTRNSQQKNRDTKRFYCDPCVFAASCQRKLDIHYNTKKHKNINN